MLDFIKIRWNYYVDKHHRLEKAFRLLGNLLPPLNYITIHYAYFIIVTLFSSLVFWASSSSFNGVPYVDSLFLVTSAITNTGLNTLNLSETTTWQQVLLWILMIIGNPIWISFWTIIVRKHAFEARFEDVVERERERSKFSTVPTLRSMFTFNKTSTDSEALDAKLPGLGSKITSSPGLIQNSNGLADFAPEPYRTIATPLDAASSDPEGVTIDSKAVRPDMPPIDTTMSALATSMDHISFAEPVSPLAVDRRTSAYQRGNRLIDVNIRRGSDESEGFMHWKRFLGKHNVTRNGQFHGLSSDEREHLGGCEYRALKILTVLVPLYSAAWQVFGSLALACWISIRTADIPTKDGVNPWWTGIFFAVSAFNNVGLSLVNDGPIPFQGEYFVLLTIGLLILVGNTAYPILLRLILWSTLKLLRLTTQPATLAAWKETFEFILKYPRRVYTTIFPSRATWWLIAVLFAINIFDWVAFEVLNLGNPAVHKLPVGHQIMVGLFQAISVRACGFTAISISSLYAGVQVLYMVMMYVSVYPVVITMRNSNVYEERSLGIYEEDPVVKEQLHDPFASGRTPREKHFLRRRNTAAVIGKHIRRATNAFQGVGVQRAANPEDDCSPISFVGQQIKGQLAHDLWWLVLAVFLIFIIETDHFLSDPTNYSLFSILFEATSAYACLGFSMGLPNVSYSLAGGLHTGSKVVLCLAMMRGRHRGLPVAIDRAVRLPGDQLTKDEEEDGRIRRTTTAHRMMSCEG